MATAGTVIYESDVFTAMVDAVVSFATSNACNVDATGGVPDGYVAVSSADTYFAWTPVSKDMDRPTSPDGHNTYVNYYDDTDSATKIVHSISPIKISINGITQPFTDSLKTAVASSTVSSEFTTYLNRYVSNVKQVISQTRLSAIILQTLMFVQNKFVAYTGTNKLIYYKSDTYVGSAYVGADVGFYDNNSFLTDTATLSAIGTAIQNLTSNVTVYRANASWSVTSCTSSCSSSSSTSSSCSSSSCSSSSSSSCSSSSCSCFFIVFYEIGGI